MLAPEHACYRHGGLGLAHAMSGFKLWRAWGSKPTVRAVGLMASSSALGQLAVFAALPLLTRLYDPAAFGLHAMFSAFAGVAGVSACLCLDVRIVSTSDDSHADEVFAAALMAIALTSTLGTLAFAGLILFNAYGYGALPLYATLPMAALMVLTGVFIACRGRAVRQQDYGLLARTGLQQNLGRAMAPLLLYPLLPFWLGLSGGELAARALGVRGIARNLWTRRLHAQVWLHPGRWWQLVRREYRFTGVLLSSVFIDACASQMIAPLLAHAFGAHAAGEYFVASMIIVAPSVLIGAGAAEVIHAKGAEIHRLRPAELPRFTRQAALGLLALACAIFIPLYLLAPLVLPLVLGAKWPGAAQAVQSLVPFAIAGFVASPCSRLLSSINRPNIKPVSDLIRLVGTPATVLICQAHGLGLQSTLWRLSWFLCAAYVMYFGLTYASVLLASKDRN